MTVHDDHHHNNIHRITNDDSQAVEEEILLERETAIHFSSFHALVRLVKECRFESEGDTTTTSPSEVKAVVVASGLTQEQIQPSSTSASVSVSSWVSVSSESVISTNPDDAANDTAGSSVQVVPVLIEVESPSGQLPSDVCIRVVQWLVVERVNMEHVTAIGCSSQYIDPNRMALRNTATPMSSSSSSSFPTKNALLSFLSDCLSDDDATWWISKEGLDDRYQYVDFRCVPTTTTTANNNTTTTNVSLSSSSSSLQPLPSYPLHRVRVRAVSLKIPPLPQGPMSLRGFVLQKSDHIDSSSSTSTTVSTSNNSNNINNNSIVWETISPLWTLESRSGWQRFVLQDPTDGPFDVRYLRILCLSNQTAALNDRRFRGLPQAVGFSCIKLD
jgi:hypothetical protein